MFARLCFVVLMLGACIRSQLVPCGDSSCPTGDLCIAQRCASPDQVQACAQLVDDDPCTLTSGTVGRCLTGICTPVGCGNRVIDPGEVCDDGNVGALDGCSGTCDSDESCGNGVLDVVTGESCDCGRDTAVQPATCVAPNSDDPTAACTLGCRLRRCGDDVIGGGEQCDGAAPIAASCGQFGFYDGDVGCSSLCQFDVSLCSGRCGDGVLEPTETCDGAAPDNQSCLDFGFDLGPLACTGVCTPGLADCDRLGWSRADVMVAQARQLWAGSKRRIMLFADGSVVVDDDGVRSVQAGPFSAIAGSSTTLYAVGASLAKQYSGGLWSDVTTAAPPWGVASPASAWASPTLGLFVAVPNWPKAYRYSTAWTEHDVPEWVAPRFGGSATKAYLFETGSSELLVWRTTADNFIPPVSPFSLPGSVTTIFDVADTSIAVYVATGAALYSGDATGASWIEGSTPASRLLTNSLGGVDVLLAGSKIQRLGQGAFGPIAAPPNVITIAEDAGRSYVAGGAAGVFSLNRGVWSDVPDPPAAAVYARVRSYRTSGIAVSGTFAAHTVGVTAGWTSLAVTGGTHDSIHGAAPDTFLHVSAIDGGLAYVPTSGSPQIADLAAVDPRSLWRADNVVFGAGIGGVATIDVMTQAVAEFPLPGVNLAAIHGLTATDVYAVGHQNGVGAVYHYNGTDWRPVDTAPETAMYPLSGVFVTKFGHVYAVGGDHIYRYGPAPINASMEWTHWQVPGATLTAVAGSKNDQDLWFVGKAEFGFAFSGLHHWDGQDLYPVRLPRAGVAHDLFVELGRLIVLLTDESTGIDSIVSLARVTGW